MKKLLTGLIAAISALAMSVIASADVIGPSFSPSGLDDITNIIGRFSDLGPVSAVIIGLFMALVAFIVSIV